MLAEEYDNVSDEFSFNTKNMMDVVNRHPVAPGKAGVNNLKNEMLQTAGAQPKIVDAMVKDYSGAMKRLKNKPKSKVRPLMPSGMGESW
jgi:hypothetical protein